MAKVKIGQLSKSIMKELGDFGMVTGMKVDKICNEVAHDAAEELEKVSPKRSGDYKDSWVADRRHTKKNVYGYIVRADAPGYRLAHLLEKGHQLKRGGRSIGKVEAIEHIAPVEKKAVEKLQRRIRSEL